MTDPTPIPRATALADWADPAVQRVYTILTDGELPSNREEHWEGWVSRRIVATLSSDLLTPDQARRMADEARSEGIVEGYQHGRSFNGGAPRRLGDLNAHDIEIIDSRASPDHPPRRTTATGSDDGGALKALRDVVREVEWSGGRFGLSRWCPSCCAYQSEGHTSDCRLHRALLAADQSSERGGGGG